MDDCRVGCGMKGRFRRSEGNSAGKGHRQQRLVGQVFVHGDVGFQPDLCCFNRFSGDFFGRPAALAESGEHRSHALGFNLEDQRISGTFRVRYVFYAAFVRPPQEFFSHHRQLQSSVESHPLRLGLLSNDLTVFPEVPRCAVNLSCLSRSSGRATQRSSNARGEISLRILFCRSHIIPGTLFSALCILINLLAVRRQGPFSPAWDRIGQGS